MSLPKSNYLTECLSLVMSLEIWLVDRRTSVRIEIFKMFKMLHSDVPQNVPQKCVTVSQGLSVCGTSVALDQDRNQFYIFPYKPNNIPMCPKLCPKVGHMGHMFSSGSQRKKWVTITTKLRPNYKRSRFKSKLLLHFSIQTKLNMLTQ